MSKLSGQTISFHISGMHCASCALNIERKLRKTSGVTTSRVNFGNEQATVVFDPKIITPYFIAQTVASLGYKAHVHDHTLNLSDTERRAELENLKTKVIFSSIMTALIFLSMAPFLPALFSNPWWLLLLATPVQFWSGRRFYQGAWSAAKNGLVSMDTLIVLGTSAAYFYSLFVVLFNNVIQQAGIPDHVYFEASSAIITFVLLGKYLEIKAKTQTSQAITELMRLQPAVAHIKTKTHFKDIAADKIKVGDRLLVKVGERIPVDGVIDIGNSALDESLVTGESLPVLKSPGDRVIGGSINSQNPLEITAVKVGQDTFLAHIIHMVQEAQGSRPPIQQLVDNISAYFVPAVILLSIITCIVWYLFGPAPHFLNALVSMIAVLIIACPCAMGLATPLSIMVSVGRGARLGILIKDSRALENGSKIMAIAFDKTGTLTEGKPVVQKFILKEGTAPVIKNDLKNYIFFLESQSAHPLAKAVTNFLKSQVNFHKPPSIWTYKELSGRGIIAEINDKRLILGTTALLKQESIFISEDEEQLIGGYINQGHTVINIALNRQWAGLIAIADTLRPASAKVIRKLTKLHLVPVMVTGDNRVIAQAIAKVLGINEVVSEVIPQDKKSTLEKLQKKFGLVGMVGDGVNDAPALAVADLSVAMGEGTEVAMASADITLLHSDISLIPLAISLSKATINNIKQNLVWAFGYNLVLIPVAMGILYPLFGIRLNPVFAGAAMALSSVSVVLNALRLRRVKLI